MLTDLGWQVHRTDEGLELQFEGNPPKESLMALQRIREPLSVRLTNLKGLDAPIAEWRVLKNLSRLDLRGTQVSDIRPLQGLTNLSHLDLANTQVSHITPLRDLNKLSVLVITGSKVKDTSPLKDLKNLKIHR